MRLYCNKCGSPVTRKQKFCMQCGNRLNRNAPVTKKHITPFRIKWLIIVIVICVTAVILIFHHNKGNSIESIEIAVKQSYVSDNNDLDNEKYLPATIEQLITQNVSTKIIEHNGNTVTLEITAPNMYELYSQITLSSDPPPNDPAVLLIVDEYIKAALQNGEYSMVKNTVTVDITKKDSEIVVIPTFDYIDAIYGNMLSYYKEITE